MKFSAVPRPSALSSHSRRLFPMAALFVVLCAARPGESAVPPMTRVGCGPADSAGLSPEEVRLWEEHGLSRPAEHLLGQASERKAGETTVLRVVVILVDFPDLHANR